MRTLATTLALASVFAAIAVVVVGIFLWYYAVKLAALWVIGG